MRNDVYMLEMTYVSEKRLKYVGYDVDMLEMFKNVGNDLEIW